MSRIEQIRMQKEMMAAERAIVGFIVAAASLCVTLISVYLCMFDVRCMLQ